MSLPRWEQDPSTLAYVQHKKAGEAVPAYPFLRQAVRRSKELPISDGILHHFFPDRSTFSPQEFTIEQLGRYTPQDLLKIFAPMLVDLYNLGQASLDLSTAHKSLGFNDHTYEGHILGVTQTGLHYLDLAQANNQQRNIFTLSSLAHDTGNVFSRDKHAEVSFDVLRRYLPTLTNEPQIAEQLRKTIYYHREETGFRLMRDLAGSTESSTDFFSNLKDEVGIPALALNIADCSDIGPHRANLYQGDTGIVDDPFQAVELLTHKKICDYNPSEQTFLFNFAFCSAPCQKIEELGYLTMPSKHQRAGRSKTIVPPDMQQAFKERGQLYSTSWLQKFQQIHGLRELVVAAFSFALFKDQQEFICRLEDEELLPLHATGKYQSVLPYERRFTRETLFKHLQAQTGNEHR